MADLISKLEGAVRHRGSKGIAGIWLEEHAFVEAARKTYDAGNKNLEAISPFPLHGIDDAIGIPRSYIPWITFVFGTLGLIFGLWFTWWTSAVDWPINVGGKPMWSLAAFIPIIFECTILFAALSSVGAMIVINGLPKIDPPIIDPDLTSHKFALFIPESAQGYDAGKLEQLFKSLGASEVKRTEF
ncbi:MAG: DUF3341 domain-containing protein [Bdellovibrionota bacterium]